MTTQDVPRTSIARTAHALARAVRTAPRAGGGVPRTRDHSQGCSH